MGWTTLFPQFIFGFVMTSVEIKNKHSQTWKSNISNDIVNGKKAVSGRYMCQWIYALSVFSMLLQMCVKGEKNCKRGIANINLLFPVWPNLAKENLVLLDRQEFIYTISRPNQMTFGWSSTSILLRSLYASITSEHHILVGCALVSKVMMVMWAQFLYGNFLMESERNVLLLLTILDTYKSNSLSWGSEVALTAASDLKFNVILPLCRQISKANK